VGVIGEAGPEIGHEPLQRVGLGPAANAGLSAFQIGLDRSPVTIDVPADRHVRPASLPECVDLHVFSLCEHELGLLPVLVGVGTASLGRSPGSLVDLRFRSTQGTQDLQVQ
jgi:hypothetical protein